MRPADQSPVEDALASSQTPLSLAPDGAQALFLAPGGAHAPAVPSVALRNIALRNIALQTVACCIFSCFGCPRRPLAFSSSVLAERRTSHLRCSSFGRSVHRTFRPRVETLRVSPAPVLAPSVLELWTFRPSHSGPSLIASPKSVDATEDYMLWWEGDTLASIGARAPAVPPDAPPAPSPALRQAMVQRSGLEHRRYDSRYVPILKVQFTPDRTR
jgi:hypothetical protein